MLNFFSDLVARLASHTKPPATGRVVGAGGLEKLVRSAAGFTKLDLDLLEEVLCRFLELSGDPHRLESLISSRPARSWVVLKVPGIPRPPIQTHCK